METSSPKYVHVLILVTYKFLKLISRRNLGGIWKLRLWSADFHKESILDYPHGLNGKHKGTSKWEREVEVVRVMLRKMVEKGSHEPRDVGSL